MKRKARKWKMWAVFAPGYMPYRIFPKRAQARGLSREGGWTGKPEITYVEVREILPKRGKK